MSLESFIGLDSGEPMSAAALEQLREKMAAAAAQIAQIQKEEKKQKKKEYDLLKILLKFVKSSQKKDLTLLISRVLEKNIPANFILAIILLGNKEIQQEIGKYLMLNDPEASEKALIFFGEKDETLPLKIKIEMDNWIKTLILQAQEKPEKLLKTAYKIEFIELEKEYDFEDTKYKEKKSIHKVLIQLIAFIVREFLESHKITEPYSKLRDFSEFILKGMLTKVQETLDNRKLLEGE
jgi:hypothetical protein